VRRNSSVGIATRYWLDGPGIESLPMPVAERSKARVCGRSLAGIASSNSAGVMDVCPLRVVRKHKNAKRRTITTKNQVRMNYRVQESIKKIR
jgi:hypothetical protein